MNWTMQQFQNSKRRSIVDTMSVFFNIARFLLTLLDCLPSEITTHKKLTSSEFPLLGVTMSCYSKGWLFNLFITEYRALSFQCFDI